MTPDNKPAAPGLVALDVAARAFEFASQWGFLNEREKEWLRVHAQAARAALSQPVPSASIDMVLHCPKCGKQHIDWAEPAVEHDHGAIEFAAWDNPPHRSHLCHNCGHIWRPADVPTNGVAAVKTKGKEDSPIAVPSAPEPSSITAELLADLKMPYGMVGTRDVDVTAWNAKLDRAIAALSSAPASAPEPSDDKRLAAAVMALQQAGVVDVKFTWEPGVHDLLPHSEVVAGVAEFLEHYVAGRYTAPPVPAARRVTQRDTPCSSLGCSWSREKGCSICGVDWIGLPAATPAGEPTEAIAQLRHLIDDLVVTYQEDGLDRHMVRDGAGLLFSNFVGAVRRLLATLPASPEPATQGAAKPVHTDHPFQHWDRTCPACVLEASPPAPAAGEPDERVLNLLARIHRDGGHYVAEHGLHKALQDAEGIVIERIAALDEIAALTTATPGLSDAELGSILARIGRIAALPTEK